MARIAFGPGAVAKELWDLADRCGLGRVLFYGVAPEDAETLQAFGVPELEDADPRDVFSAGEDEETGSFRVKCLGRMHLIVVRGPRLRAVHHSPDELQLLKKLGEDSRCADLDGMRLDEACGILPRSALHLKLDLGLGVDALPEIREDGGSVEFSILPAVRDVACWVWVRD